MGGKRPFKYIVMTCKDSQLLSKILYVNWLLEIFMSAHRLRLLLKQHSFELKDTTVINRPHTIQPSKRPFPMRTHA